MTDVATHDRPTGQITFMFTDIEGSTRLVETLGTAGWRPVLERHRQLVRAALETHHGLEIGTEGDSFFAVFRDPIEAVAATAEAQRSLAAEAWPAHVAVRVRMGLHLGIGELDADGSYIGHDVHRAARVAAAASGGQVLLSETAVAIVANHLPDGVALRQLGSHRLKDLRPERIAQLDLDGMPADFPPIRSLDARPNNLPTELTSFVGRERELAEARALLERARMVTLTGPGGTGKTRLALQLAAAVAHEYPDGVWFVALGPVRESELVPSVIAHTLDIGDDPSQRPLDTLSAALAERRMLLVLDNLEQVISAGASLAEILRRAPLIRMLTTSRAPLRISGEQEFPVPGLPAPVELDHLGPYQREQLPESLRRHDPETLLGFESVNLFVARGRAVRPGFELTETNAGDVALIVAHLGGAPLAIELAAARLRFLTPAAIRERLEGRLDLPGAGAADAPERQRTLRGAIAWSDELLDPPVRRLFRRLGVFVGGFDLACAEAVAGPPDELGIDVLDGLAALVDQSLVRSDEIAGEPRFSLLEPIREYALEELSASGNETLIRERHARAYDRLARDLEPALAGAGQRDALDRLELEHANLRQALEWAEETGDAELALGLVAAVWRLWQKRGHLREARARVEALLSRPWFEHARPPLRARAHEVMGGIIYWHGDMLGARPHYQLALDLWQADGDRAEIANALYNLSFSYSMASEGAHQPEIATGQLQEALGIYRALGDDRGTANVLWGIGIQAYFRNSNEEAASAFEEALGLYRKAGDRTQEAWALHQLGSARLKLGDVDTARRHVRDALRIFDQAGDVAGVSLALDDLSAVAVGDGDLPRAARLQGLARRIQASSGTGLAALVQETFETLTRPDASNRLDPDQLARFREQGAALPLPDGIRYALGAEIAVPATEPVT